MTEKTDALLRLRELLIKRSESVGEACRINRYVETLVKQANHAQADQFDDIVREIEKNRMRVEQITREVETARPQILAEIERITEILGEKSVLDEISKHPLEPVISVQ